MNLGDMTVGASQETLFLCPYDKTHVIRRKILPYHLMKCRKNWTGKEYKICPFNSNHEVPAPEFIGHKQMCEDRYIIERDLEVEMKKRKEKSGCTLPLKQPPEPEIVPASNEDWDRDIKMEDKLFRTRLTQSLESGRRGGGGGGAVDDDDHPSIFDNSVGGLSSPPPPQRSRPVASHRPYYDPMAPAAVAAAAAAADRRLGARIDVSDNSFHRTREPTTHSIALGGGAGGRAIGGRGVGDLYSTQSRDTTYEVGGGDDDDDFDPNGAVTSSYDRRNFVSQSRSSNFNDTSNDGFINPRNKKKVANVQPFNRPSIPAVGAAANLPQPTARSMGRGSLSAATMQQAAALGSNPGSTQNSFVSGFGVGLRNREAAAAASSTTAAATSTSVAPFAGAPFPNQSATGVYPGRGGRGSFYGGERVAADSDGYDDSSFEDAMADQSGTADGVGRGRAARAVNSNPVRPGFGSSAVRRENIPVSIGRGRV